MRDLTSMAIGCCFASYMLFALVLNAQVKAEQRSAPWDSVGCNDACRWWMNLGGKPAADIKPPPPSGPSPALSAKAIVPDATLAAAGTPASNASVMKSLASEDRTGRIRSPGRAPAPMLLPPERPAFIPGQSLWNVQITGSAPVLPGSLLTFP